MNIPVIPYNSHGITLKSGKMGGSKYPFNSLWIQSLNVSLSIFKLLIWLLLILEIT